MATRNLSWIQSRLYDFSSVILRNLVIDCRTDPSREFLEQEWKKEKDLLLAELFPLALDLPNIISQNEWHVDFCRMSKLFPVNREPPFNIYTGCSYLQVPIRTTRGVFSKYLSIDDYVFRLNGQMCNIWLKVYARSKGLASVIF